MDGKIFRVWFLNGEVQCAVQRSIAAIDHDDDETSASRKSAEDFTLGCVAGSGVCQRSSSSLKPLIQPWEVPDEVKHEIEERLLPVLPRDAHCGSVEFLNHYSASNYNFAKHDEETVARRLYFDLNLLSTLPTDDHLNGAPDPWLQLAGAIWTLCSSTYAND